MSIICPFNVVMLCISIYPSEAVGQAGFEKSFAIKAFRRHDGNYAYMKIYRKKVAFVNGRIVSAEKMSGGRADGMSVKDIAEDQDVDVEEVKKNLDIGSKVEKEHVKNKSLTREIAKDHLVEDIDYYKMLDEMESKAKKSKKDKKG